MRRKDREMTSEFAMEVVDKCEWATIAMVTPDKTPYCVPVTIARIGGFIYFHCAKDGQKIDCLNSCDDVCVSCVGNTLRLEDEFSTKYESAIVFGKAVRVTDDNEKIAALRELCLRHTPTNMKNFDEAIQKSLWRTDIWKVSIDSITGKSKR
ncbi:MAG: pyridoxamine 5'-phosphate oxidase family protein [Clostridia bacterium]|nr:pyridoxamine 5'-phosphate oxidase family protein [Clostridia bacterium]MDE7328928.1 pyridoxamine 5'-phosphate oxidase family protein [Clostridia bacterium]